MKSAMAFYLRYLLIAGAITGACYSVILGRAAYLFSKDQADSIRSAVQLVPYKSEYVARWASWNKAEEVPLLKRAVELNPFDYESLIELGLVAEFKEGDLKAAERYFLSAEAVNHMYKPKLTLTNFYARRQDTSEFFHWANETLKISPWDEAPVFMQMWLMSQDAQRLSAVIPDRPRSLIQYTWFLSNNKQYTAIPPIIQRLVRVVGNDNPHDWGRDDLIASSLDHVLESGHMHTGLQIWSTLRDGRWIPQNIPDANHPLTNGDFRLEFYRHGFDWKPMKNDGVQIDQYTDLPAVEIDFSGHQSEQCELLRQYVAVESGFLYKLRWKAEAEHILPGSGINWRLRAANGDASVDIASGDLLNTPQVWEFVAPPNVDGFVLTLEYRRAFAHTRPTGKITLRSVSMEREE
jgi:hypothetical protein